MEGKAEHEDFHTSYSSCVAAVVEHTLCCGRLPLVNLLAAFLLALGVLTASI
jgi:hypothetical protein